MNKYTWTYAVSSQFKKTKYELIGFGMKQLQRVYVLQFLAPSVNEVLVCLGES